MGNHGAMYIRPMDDHKSGSLAAFTFAGYRIFAIFGTLRPNPSPRGEKGPRTCP